MLIDVTKSMYNGIPVWPGDTPFERTEKQNAGFSSSKVVMSLHTGTHMDAPSHRFTDGITIDQIPPFIVPALVMCPGNSAGKAVLFEGPISGKEAEELVKSGAVLVGTASISIDYEGSEDAHAAILGAGIPVVENLELGEVAPGEYIIMAFPLKFAGADGSPVRVILAETASDIVQ